MTLTRQNPIRRRTSTRSFAIASATAILSISLTLLLMQTIAGAEAFVSSPISFPSRGSGSILSSQHQQQHHARAAAAASSDNSNLDSDTVTMMVDELMTNTYDALATRLIDRYEKDNAAAAAASSSSNNNDSSGSGGSLRNNQLFVGLAGGPGSGKSTLAAAVAQRINDRMTNRNNTKATTATTTTTEPEKDDDNHGGSSDDAAAAAAAAVVLPMDGFHYSRSQLKSMASSLSSSSSSSDIGSGYTYEELIARRGAPWTFDAEACTSAFLRARRTGKASLPTYSRTKSDPVPNGAELHSDTKIVLLEGNYLLAWDDERWAPLKAAKEGGGDDGALFDETWYIACASLEEQRERLVRRHLETWSEEKTRMWGEGAAGAGAKADANE